MGSDFPQRHEDLERLINRAFDGLISEQERALLNHLLSESREAVDFYIAYLEVQGRIAWEVGGISIEAGDLEAAGTECAVAPSPRSKSLLDRASRHPLIPSIGVAVVIFVALIVTMAVTPAAQWIAGNGDDESRQREDQTPSEYVAKLNGWQNDVWLEGSRPPRDDPRLKVGRRLVLASGLIEIKYNTGARVVLEGPAEFTIGTEEQGTAAERARKEAGRGSSSRSDEGTEAQSEGRSTNTANSGYLARGKLVALVEGEEAQGFFVDTPSARVEDLGTEFGIEVNANSAAIVHVFSGKIVAETRDAAGELTGNRRELSEGKAVRVSASGGVKEISSNRRRFTQWTPKIPQQTKFIAYRNLRGAPGGQEIDASLGHDFEVQQPIHVTRLGAFDSDADGLKRTITVTLWSRDAAGTPDDPKDDQAGEPLTTMTFTPEDPGELVASSRFKPLAKPLLLARGHYTIVAYGYGQGEPNGNADFGPDSRYRRTDSGRGAIRFVGLGRHGEGAKGFPLELGRGPANRYSAATFEFDTELTNE